MAIVDERGRVFGRWNLLDLVALVLVVGMIPLAYAGYLLFRDQPPTITGITPARAEEAQEFHFTLRGTNFRPYMRASAGNNQAREFVFKSTEEAELPFAYLPPGVYDVILYDSAQERFRLPRALTISRSSLPTTKMIAVGAFGNLDAAGVAKITAGTELGTAGKVINVGKPVADITQVIAGPSVVGVGVPGALALPAVIEFNCDVRVQGGLPFCTVEGTTVGPNVLVTVQTPLGKTPFQIVRVRGSEPAEPVTITARFSGATSLLSKIKPGDIDMAGTSNELAAQARVESVASIRSNGDNAAVDVKLVAQLQPRGDTWLYDAAVLRAGSAITLRTSGYEVHGIVIDIPAPALKRP